MVLVPGARFGAFEIGESIGSGGMGEVYRATDTNLKRDVAIKVLPESFAADENRLARFQREAEVLASLNHPNIAQIHGLERSDGTTALVMELVEGPTLADRIAEGPLPADEALGIAMQIADALEAAHGQNIVHRDLKPANIKLRPDGTVKVLDFGIAKALDIRTLSGPEAPALTTPAMTQAGIILGTAAYMSPEQARGKAVDQRADIWAFGCLLYEMLTGQPAFAGEDVAITLARILANDTDMKSLPAAISPAVRQTIELCLQKDAGKRIADIRDVKLALAGAFDTVSPQARGAVAGQPLWGRPFPVATAAVVVTALVVSLVAWILRPSPEPRPVNRFDYDLPDDQLLRNTGRSVMTLSPDGRHFVYNTADGLYLRTMGELEARLISGTEPVLTAPVFSPDSAAVAYWDGLGQVKRIAISGGVPVVIGSNLSNPFGMSWGADGTLLIGQRDGIYRLPANGGTPERIIETEDGMQAYGPRLLPDGDSVLFTIVPLSGTWDTGQIVAQSLSTGERRVLIEGGNDARYVPTGHLVYALGDALFAVAFDVDSMMASGGAVPLVQGVMRAGNNQSGIAQYGVTEGGTLAYVVSPAAVVETRTLVWVDRTGREESLGLPPRNYVKPRVSPDGTKLALDVRDQELDVWTWDLERRTLQRLTFDPGEDEFPLWSPDGRRIAFVNANRNLLWKAADGSGSTERLVENASQIFPTSFLPDASGILLYGTNAAANDDIAIFRFEAESPVTPLLETTFNESLPQVSPDGRWLAYVSDESGSEEVYVRPFPDIDAGRWQVSMGGGVQPLWARSGLELFYRNGESMFAVPILTDPGFVADSPEELFEGDYVFDQGGTNYDVSPDGQRFLMIERLNRASQASQIIIVENWFEELKRLVPTE